MSAIELIKFQEQIDTFSYAEQLLAIKIIIESMQKKQSEKDNYEMQQTENELLQIRKSGYSTIRELLKDDEW